MSDELAAVRDELRSVAREQLSKAATDAELDWKQLAQSGWLGLEADAAFDGAGATFVELAVLLGEMGRAAARSAMFGGVVLGVATLNELVAGNTRDELLRAVVSGQRRVAVVLNRSGEDAAIGTAPFQLAQSEHALQLTGSAKFVADAIGADQLLLRASNADGNDLIVVVDASDVTIAEQPVIDATRQFATVSVEGLAVEPSALCEFTLAAATDRLLDRGALALACDSAGIIDAMLTATVAYASTREQFGRPIGSFQAVKHACADMLVQLTVARQLVDAAVAQVAEHADDSWVAVSMAKSYATQAAVDVAGKAMQLHGGIGYTWEGDVHRYLKRALLNRVAFGSVAQHRQRLAQRYGDQLGV